MQAPSNKILILCFSLAISISYSFLNGMQQNLFVSEGKDRCIKIFDISGDYTSRIQPKRKINFRPIGALKFSHNGELMAATTKALSWFTMQGENLVSIKEKGIILFDTSSKKCKKWKICRTQFGKHTHQNAKTIWALAFHPQGHLLVSGSGNKTIKAWNIIADQPLQESNKLSSEPSQITISKSNNLVATSLRNGKLLTWDMTKNALLGDIAKEIKTLALHPHNDQLLVSGSKNGTIRLWDIRTLRCVKKINEESNESVIALISTASCIFFATEKDLNIVSIKKTYPRRLTLTRDSFCSMALRGRKMLLGTRSGMISLLNLHNMKTRNFPTHKKAVHLLEGKPQKYRLKKRLQHEEIERIAFAEQVIIPNVKIELNDRTLAGFAFLFNALS